MNSPKHLIGRAFLLYLSLILTFSYKVSNADKDLYKLVLHSQEEGAACLDGSPPGLYIHEGTEKSKFMIFFDGGGYCGGNTLDETLKACYKRSLT